MSNITIITGGPGSERAVSLRSAVALELSLVGSGYSVTSYQTDGTTYTDGLGTGYIWSELIPRIQDSLVFGIIHGEFWEDGTLRTLLDSAGIASVFSPAEVMKLANDKYEAGKYLGLHGVRTPRTLLVDQASNISELCTHAESALGYPMILKPRHEGSSIWLTKVTSRAELESALRNRLTEFGEILLQECIVGREFTCGVVFLDGQVRALPPTEIILTQGELFDYEAKYTPGVCREITPALIDLEMTESIQRLALRTHELMGAEDMSRTDMILMASGELVALEINTIPGLTQTSFIPAQLSAAGSSLGEWVRGMIQKYWLM